MLRELEEVPSLRHAIRSQIAARGSDQVEFDKKFSGLNQHYAVAYQQNAILRANLQKSENLARASGTENQRLNDELQVLKNGIKNCQMYHATIISKLEEKVNELEVKNAELASQHETDIAFIENYKRGQSGIAEFDNKQTIQKLESQIQDLKATANNEEGETQKAKRRKTKV